MCEEVMNKFVYYVHNFKTGSTLGCFRDVNYCNKILLENGLGNRNVENPASLLTIHMLEEWTRKSFGSPSTRSYLDKFKIVNVRGMCAAIAIPITSPPAVTVFPPCGADEEFADKGVANICNDDLVQCQECLDWLCYDHGTVITCDTCGTFCDDCCETEFYCGQCPKRTCTRCDPDNTILRYCVECYEHHCSDCRKFKPYLTDKTDRKEDGFWNHSYQCEKQYDRKLMSLYLKTRMATKIQRAFRSFRKMKV